MKALVINLDSRLDRLAQAQAQSACFPEGLIRISAVGKEGIATNKIEFVAVGVKATWKSHQYAYKHFLENFTDSHCLILEDDFEVIDKCRLMYALQCSRDFDFLQVGFLTPHLSDFAYRKIWDFQALLIRITKVLRNWPFFKNAGVFSTRTFKEYSQVPKKTVLHDVHAGGHAYIISRSFAEGAMIINDPVFLSADGVFMALAKSRAFRMGRLRRSAIRQSNSPTSVESRFIN